MNRSEVQSAVMIILILLLFGCKKAEDYPVEPVIVFEEFLKILDPYTGVYERGVLKISFTDGDGDIGLTQSDTSENFIITYLEIQNGDTVEVELEWYDKINDTLLPINHNARIPILTPEGNNKSIKGEIADTLFIYNFTSPFDTLLFRAYILDRAQNRSNEIITPLIVRK